MTEFVPLLQSIVWFVLAAGIIFWYRNDLKCLIKAVTDRIELGDSIEAGTTGIKLGSSHQYRVQTSDLAAAGESLKL